MNKFDSTLLEFVDIQLENETPVDNNNTEEKTPSIGKWTEGDAATFLKAANGGQWGIALSVLLGDESIVDLLSEERLSNLKQSIEGTIKMASSQTIGGTSDSSGAPENKSIATEDFNIAPDLTSSDSGSTAGFAQQITGIGAPKDTQSIGNPATDQIQGLIENIYVISKKINSIANKQNIDVMSANLKKAFSSGGLKDHFDQFAQKAKKSGWQNNIKSLAETLKSDLGGGEIGDVSSDVKKEQFISQFNDVINEYVESNNILINEYVWGAAGKAVLKSAKSPSKLLAVFGILPLVGVAGSVASSILNTIGFVITQAITKPIQLLKVIIKYLKQYKSLLLKLFFPVSSIGVMIIGPEGGKQLGPEMQKWIEGLFGFGLSLATDLLDLTGITTLIDNMGRAGKGVVKGTINSIKSIGSTIGQKIAGVK